MTVRLPNATFTDDKSGRATWGRAVVDALRGLVQRLADYLPLTGGTLTGDLSVPDEAYGAGWDGSTEVPTKNALYDKIETIAGGGVSDGDKGDIVVSGSGSVWSFDSGVVTAFAKTFLDDANAGAVRSTLGLVIGTDVLGMGGGTLTGDLSVPDEAYDATNWNGSVEVPTKNAVRDKIESLATSSMVKISSQVLGSAAATIDFSSIPSGYEDLVLVLMARGTNASTSVDVQMIYNNDSAANYDGEKFHYYSTGVGNAQYAGQAFATFCQIPGSTAPAGAAGSSRLELPAYARSVFHKAGFVNWANKIGTGTFSQGIGQYGHAWRSTSAVNRITLSLSAGNFDTGTVATLYGRG